MKRFAALLLLLFASACLSCAHVGGPAAPSEISEVMTHAVLVETMYGAVTPEGPVFHSSTGSGVVIGTDGEWDVFLTARHVCAVPETVKAKLADGTVFEAQTVMPLYRIVDRSGKAHRMEVLRMSEDVDICLARYEGHASVPVKVASSMPPRGAWVELAGAPNGIWDPEEDNTVIVVEGRYLGLVREGTAGHEPSVCALYSIPVTAGASGSGIYYRGELVGILTMGDMHYEHAAFADTLYQIEDFLKGK